MDQVSPQARCFIMMDIRWGFHHIPVEEESRKRTCFYGPDGRLYRWKVMTFGWKNAPAFFHHWMAHLTHNLAGVYFYVDDICVEGGTWKETLTNLEALVKRLEELRVSVAIKKLQIGPQVKMLGWVRDAAGFHPRADRMEALQRCASPANKGELRSVLGALRFLSPGVPGLNRTIARLNRLTGNVPWEWLPEDEAALRKGMQLLAHHVAQAPLRWDLPFMIRCDASEDGIGGYLLQQVPVGAAVEEHVIMCWSRGYGNGPMSRWATVEKEAYALIYAVDQCAKYVAGSHFVIETDHRPLLWMLQGVAKQNTGGKIFRWFYLLSSFDFEIRHIAGTTNVLADALSRSPVVPARGGVECERNDREREHQEAVPRVNVTQQIKTKVSDNKGKEEADEQPHLSSEGEQRGEVELAEPIWGQEPQTPQSEFQEDAFQTVVVHLKQAGGVPKRFQSEQYEEVVAEALEWQSELQLVNGRLKYGSAFYIPKLQRPQLLFNAHSAPTGGHFGVRPTTLKLDGRAWWPGWKQDVETWCRTCGSCQRNKIQPPIKGDVQPLEVTTMGESVHVDLMGPYPTTDRGNRYILTMKDAATKYRVWGPLAEKTAGTVGGVMVKENFLVYGWPERLISDNGKEFANQLNAELCDALGISQRFTAPYHPASNGQVERSHREILVVLRCVTEPNQTRWDLDLVYVQFAINTTWTRVTGTTPFFLVFGRHPRTAIDVAIGTDPERFNSATDWLERLKRAREVAAARSGLARGLQPPEERTEEEAPPALLTIGDLVLVRFTGAKEGLSTKLAKRQQGPYRVVKVYDDGMTADLQHVERPTDTLRRHVSSLIRFRSSGDVSGEEPSPLEEEEEGDDEFEVERILDEKRIHGQTEFLVRWAGFGSDRDSWVAENKLFAPGVLEAWRDEQRRREAAKVVVQRVLETRVTDQGDTLYLVEVDESAGPDGYQWVHPDQVRNPAILRKAPRMEPVEVTPPVAVAETPVVGASKGQRKAVKAAAPKKTEPKAKASAPRADRGGVGRDKGSMGPQRRSPNGASTDRSRAGRVRKPNSRFL